MADMSQFLAVNLMIDAGAVLGWLAPSIIGIPIPPLLAVAAIQMIGEIAFLLSLSGPAADRVQVLLKDPAIMSGGFKADMYIQLKDMSSDFVLLTGKVPNDPQWIWDNVQDGMVKDGQRLNNDNREVKITLNGPELPLIKDVWLANISDLRDLRLHWDQQRFNQLWAWYSNYMIVEAKKAAGDIVRGKTYTDTTTAPPSTTPAIPIESVLTPSQIELIRTTRPLTAAEQEQKELALKRYALTLAQR